MVNIIQPLHKLKAVEKIFKNKSFPFAEKVFKIWY